MITRIELENFKGIRERVALDLKPITLLFGANSAGKSTVIHALHYALEVLRYQNLDADRTTLGGESIDLGGFRNLVHAHDLDRRITMLFEFDVEGTLRDHTEGVSDMLPVHRGPPGPNLEGADLDDRIFTAWVRLEIGWSRPLGKPVVFLYEVGTNGNREQPVVRIEAGTGKGQVASLVLHLFDTVFDSGPDGEGTEASQLAADAGLSITENHAGMTAYQESALPEWGRPLRLWLADGTTPVAPALVELRRVVSKLAVGVGELLVSKLERLVYLGPLRTVPPRNYRPALTEDVARWPEGLAAWDAMHRGGAWFVSRVSDWMKRLGTGYRLELRSVLEVAPTVRGATNVLETIIGAVDHNYPLQPDEEDEAELGDDVPYPLSRFQISQLRAGLKALVAAHERDELVLIDDRNGVAVRPADVGVGISQVLPVLVAALYRGKSGAGRFLAVEQPELHIHPKLQVVLADLFIEQSGTGTMSDHTFLLETHSEHILLRVLRRIRETGEKSEATEQARPRERSAGPTKRGRATKMGGGSEAPSATRGRSGSAATKARRVEAHETGESPDATGVGERAPSGADSWLGSFPDDPKVPFTPDRVSVIYVQRKDDGSTDFVPLRIDESGEFRDLWPEGFFDERSRELY